MIGRSRGLRVLLLLLLLLLSGLVELAEGVRGLLRGLLLPAAETGAIALATAFALAAHLRYRGENGKKIIAAILQIATVPHSTQRQGSEQ